MASRTSPERGPNRTVLDTAPPSIPGEADVQYGYEHSNIRLGGFAKAVAWFIGVGVVVYVVVWYTMIGLKDFTARADRRDKAATPAVQPARLPETSPPPPTLQRETQDWQEMDVLREAQAGKLAAKGWGRAGYTGDVLLPRDAADSVAPRIKVNTKPPATRPAASGTGGGE